MGVGAALNKLNLLRGQTDIGKLTAHTLFPNEFEYYLISFELLDSGNNQKVTDRLIFPVMPENIEISQMKATTIKKSFGGVIAYTNNAFEPITITMNGTFGRRMRLLIGNKRTDEVKDNALGKLKALAGSTFFPSVKSGYGVLKSLERIYEKATTNGSSNKPYIVNFYNLSFNQAFVVKFNSFSVNQSLESNTVWHYSLQLTAVAPAEGSSILGIASGALLSAGMNVINNKLNNVVSDIRS
jgi:hypothetical protein